MIEEREGSFRWKSHSRGLVMQSMVQEKIMWFEGGKRSRIDWSVWMITIDEWFRFKIDRSVERESDELVNLSARTELIKPSKSSCEQSYPF